MINKIFEFIKNLFTPQPFLGILADTRSQDEKELDALHEEVAAGLSPITWTIKSPDQWKHIDPLRSQNLDSSDCCAFSGSSATQADKGLNYALSPRDLYDRRSNYPGEGMIPFEAEQLIVKYGIVKDSTLPSDNLLEEILNIHVKRTPEMIAEALTVSGGTPVQFKTFDIDSIASVIAQELKVRICFQFSEQEWMAIPQLISNGSIRHRVVATDFSIVNGKKCLIIQDSCFLNSTYNFPHGLRAITEDFLNARCFSATYIKPDAPVTPQPAPVHVFTVDMGYGDNNNEVMLLQTKLQSLGYFNYPTSTGYFGGLTKQAVINYQRDRNIPMTGYVSTLTRAALNK